MAMTIRVSRAELLARDTILQRLAQEHLSYEAQLDQLSTTPYVSTEDLLLEVNLKKLKLRVRDEMEERVALLARTGEIH